MEDDILTQEDDNIEEEMKAEETKQQGNPTKEPVSEENSEENINETYEAFSLPARMGITNTVTGETIEGFNPETDAALVLALKKQFNMLDKIAISAGA